MAFIRLVHPKHYDSHKGRFIDLAFKKSSDGGLSVFCSDCAEATSGLICSHIARFYPDIAGDPPIMLPFKAEVLPADIEVLETPSDTGDLCHREIDNISNGRLKKALMALPLTDYLICANDGLRVLDGADLEGLG